MSHYAPPSRVDTREAAPALVALAAAGVLAGAAAAGHLALGVVLLVVQVVVLLAWLALVDVPGGEGAFAVGVAAALAADLLAVRRDGDGVSAVVGVLAASFVAALALQLFRPHRERVTDAVAGTLAGVVLAVLGAHLLATSARTDWSVAATGVLAAATALVVGRAADLLLARPAVVHGARRGLLGLLLGVAAAGALGAILGGVWAPLSSASGTVTGVACGAAAVITDLALDLVDNDTTDPRKRSALTPLLALLPLVVAAPVAYAVARLLIG